MQVDGGGSVPGRFVNNGYQVIYPFRDNLFSPILDQQLRQLIADAIDNGQQTISAELTIAIDESALADGFAPSFEIFASSSGGVPVIGGGDWQFSCMDARDVGRAMVHLLDVPVQQAEIFLVKGFDITWLDVKTALDKKLGKPSALMNIPKGVALFMGRIMEAITPFGKEPALTRFSASVVSTHTLFDDSKIRRSGFEPQYSLEATLDDALE